MKNLSSTTHFDGPLHASVGAAIKRRPNMHIHGNLSNLPLLPANATQATQRAIEANRAALAVRKKLTAFAANDDNDAVTQVETSAQNQQSPPQKQSQPTPEEFRSIFFSLTI
jgi:hypothetical protein